MERSRLPGDVRALFDGPSYAHMAISVTAHDRPFAMAGVRGRVVERLEGDLTRR